ncbi:unnamed protein product [Diatraea saccharalis]|uniref:COMM domain-containing protein n=1 Tax=Diatraea saccharalis TaxID=40085 RepID=A0A9N9R7E4_9NEOP|nr:unnamed protein product [Diatraea saccharalis]
MNYYWIKNSQSLTKGILVINQLEEAKFEQFLCRIVTKLKIQDTEFFTEEERRKLEKIFKINDENLLLAIKTILYLFKKMLKFIFMPANLKLDLKDLGLHSEKAEIFVKVWSSETRTVLNELGTTTINDSMDSLSFPWKLNAELSSEYHKKCKVPKTYITFASEKEELELELNHPEIYSVFLQFEAIQNELDNLM